MRLILFLISLTTLSSFADIAPTAAKSVLYCRFNGSSDTAARTYEISKQANGDLILRLTGKQLFAKIDPTIRAVEVFYRAGSCNPKSANHWLSGYLYTCIDSSQVYFRDGNGEALVIKSDPARIYFNTWLWNNVFGVAKRYYYELRFTLDGKNINDTLYFDVSGNRPECRTVG